MGKKFGSKRWNRGWTCGLPVDSPLLGFETVKNSPGFVRNGLLMSMCFGMYWAGNGRGLRVHKVNR